MLSRRALCPILVLDRHRHINGIGGGWWLRRVMPTTRDPMYRGYRFPAEVISYAVWLYFRFPLSLRMVEEMLAARGIWVTYETVRRWGKKFRKDFSGAVVKTYTKTR